jgi:hypothetical protein
MGLELIEFDEGAAVEQELDALAGGHAARLALAALAILATTELGLAREFAYTVDILLESHLVKPRILSGYGARAEYINCAKAAETRGREGPR